MNRIFGALAALCVALGAIAVQAAPQQTNSQPEYDVPDYLTGVVMNRVGDGTHLRTFRVLNRRFPREGDPRRFTDFLKPLSEQAFQNAVVQMTGDTLSILTVSVVWTGQMEMQVTQLIGQHFSTDLRLWFRSVPMDQSLQALFPELASQPASQDKPTAARPAKKPIQLHGEFEVQVAWDDEGTFRSGQLYLTAEDAGGKLTLTARIFVPRDGVNVEELTIGHRFRGKAGQVWLRGGMTSGKQPIIAGMVAGSIGGHGLVGIEDLKLLHPGKLNPTLFQKWFLQLRGPLWIRWENFLVFAPSGALETSDQLGLEFRHGLGKGSITYFVTAQWDFVQKGGRTRAGIRF